MIEKPKKERRFLKALGRVGEILIQEVLIKVGSNLIKRIGGKKTLPSILFLFLSISLFAQYPNSGNKQRLGFQTTGDGLVWRGSISDTASIQPVSNQNAWVILDTVNLKFYSFDFTSNVWNQLPSGTTIDTTSLSNRINLKVNIADTSDMLTNYLRSGVAASTYLTQSSADSTYLPLTGGTLTGALNGTTGTFISNNLPQLSLGISGISEETRLAFVTGNIERFKIFSTNSQSSITFQSPAQESAGRGYRFISSWNTESNLGLVQDPRGNVGIKSDATGNDVHPNTLYVNGTLGVTGATTLTGGINGNTTFNNGNVNIGIITSSGISTSSPKLITMDETFGNNTVGTNFKLKLFQDNLTNTYGFGISNSLLEIVSGNSGAIAFFTNGANERMRILSGGDVGIGTIAPNSKLDVRGSVIINEDSGDFDTRIESDGNANMVFVDASTDRVGIGTDTPSKTLDINGEVKIATVTATPTSLLGKDGSNVVGNVRLTSPLSLAGDSLNLGTVPISKGGTGATSASLARNLLSVDYVFVESTAGASVSLTSNKVSLVNTGGASTTQLDLTTATNGRMYMIKNLASGTVISDASNVIPFNGGSAGTAILSAGNVTPQWCTLVADGTNWHIIQRN